MSDVANNLHGLLIVDKPGLNWDHAIFVPDSAAVAPCVGNARLLTSHDVVLQVRRWSGQRRIGHTGTLDPFASGVLALCLGQATRLVEYYQGHDKVYLALVVVGVATDTYDATGVVTEHQDPPPLDVAMIERALDGFRGAIMQTPPVYAALKQGGESLYKKARRGESVTALPRPVVFHRIDLLSFTPPNCITLRVHCSAGAYIRSLAHDLGQALGSVAHLAALRREAAGPFTLAHAHSLEEIRTAGQSGSLEQLLLPLGAGLNLPTIVLDGDAARRMGFGQMAVIESDLTQNTLVNSTAALLESNETILAQAQDATGCFLGVLRRVGRQESDGRSLWKAEKWLAGQRE